MLNDYVLSNFILQGEEMNEELISLIIGWVFIAGFLIMLEIMDRKQKAINRNFRSKTIKHKKELKDKHL